MIPKRTDANQTEITHALQKVGATVEDTHEHGRGFPDIVVGFRGITTLMEIKIPGAKLNTLEKKWHADWRGGRVVVVHGVSEALAAIGAVSR